MIFPVVTMILNLYVLHSNISILFILIVKCFLNALYYNYMCLYLKVAYGIKRVFSFNQFTLFLSIT